MLTTKYLALNIFVVKGLESIKCARNPLTLHCPTGPNLPRPMIFVSKKETTTELFKKDFDCMVSLEKLQMAHSLFDLDLYATAAAQTYCITGNPNQLNQKKIYEAMNE